MAPTGMEPSEALVVNIFDEILSAVDQRHPRLLQMPASEVTATVNGTLSIRSAKAAARLLREADHLDGEDLLPGLSIPLAEVFE